MTIAERIEADLVVALKGRVQKVVETLRMLRSSLHNEEIRTGQRPLPDGDAVKVIRREAKRRTDAAVAYRSGGRDDRAEAEEAERVILEKYLPAELPDEELKALVERAIASVGATGPADVGKVMKAAMADVGDRASGKAVSDLVRKALTSNR